MEELHQEEEYLSYSLVQLRNYVASKIVSSGYDNQSMVSNKAKNYMRALSRDELLLSIEKIKQCGGKISYYAFNAFAASHLNEFRKLK